MINKLYIKTHSHKLKSNLYFRKYTIKKIVIKKTNITVIQNLKLLTYCLDIELL